MIKSLIALFLALSILGCNGGSSSGDDNSKPPQTPNKIILRLQAERLHAFTDTPYALFADGEDITQQSAITSDDVAIAYYKEGKIYAQNSGTTTLHIHYDGAIYDKTINVYDANVTLLQASSDKFSIHTGFSSKLTCNAFFDDGTSQDIGDSVRYSSSDTTVARVLNGRLIAKKAGKATVSAAYQNYTTRFEVTVVPGILERIDLEIASAQLHENEYLQLYAKGIFTNGYTEDITQDVHWSSSSTQIASIDTNALVYAKRNGTTRIKAAYGDLQEQIRLDVKHADITQLDILDPSATLALFDINGSIVGDEGCLQLRIRYSDGASSLHASDAVWRSFDPDTMLIDRHGCFRTRQASDVTVEASFGGKKTQKTFSVKRYVADRLVINAYDTALDKGVRTTIGAYLYDTDDRRFDLSHLCYWQSSNPDILSIENATAFARESGIATVSARLHSLQNKLDFSVGDIALSHIKILFDTNTTLPLGYKTYLKAIGYFIDGTSQPIEKSVTWSSSDELVAILSNEIGAKGYLETVGTGEVTITASYKGAFDTLTLRVIEPIVSSLYIDVAQNIVQRSKTLQLRAYAVLSNGYKRDFTDVVTWSAYPTFVGIVNKSGLFYAKNIGYAYIGATYHGIVAPHQTIEVIEPKLLSLSVEQSAYAIDINESATLKAYALYADGRRDDITAKVTWLTKNPQIASIEANGTVHPIDDGNAEFVATYKGINATAKITVYKSIASLAISSNKTSLDVNESINLSAIATYIDNSSADVTTQSGWKSDNDAIATIDGNGKLTGIASGSVRIEVQYDDFNASKIFTVN